MSLSMVSVELKSADPVFAAAGAAGAAVAISISSWAGAASGSPTPSSSGGSPRARQSWADLADSEDTMDSVLSGPWFTKPVISEAETELGKASFGSEQASTIGASSDSETDSSSALAMVPPPPESSVAKKKSSTSATKHEPGSCKQCVFYFSPAGCTKGEDCDFCHVSYTHCGNKRLSKSKRDRYRKLLAAKMDELDQGVDITADLGSAMC